MTTAAPIPVSRIEWKGAVRIIRSAFPPIDLFEDIVDPADWPLLISAEQKTNPRIMATIGNLDLVPGRTPCGRNRRVLSDGARSRMSVPTGRAGLPTAATACSMRVIASRPRSLKRSTTMPALWPGPPKPRAGPRSFVKSSCRSPPSYTTSGVPDPPIKQFSIRTAIGHLNTWRET